MMGVTGLWSILDELGEKKDLNYLSGKRVAIDLSGWVVQAFTTPGLNTSKNPHLRNLILRVYQLLHYGIHPIFVIEGKMPSLKEATFKKRNCEHFSGGNVSRFNFDKRLEECQKLLKSLGVPCIKASGEAEAYCAFLCLKQKVDGVLTEDGDALLYGAHTIYRAFTKHINDVKTNSSMQEIKVYSLKSEKNSYKLDRTKFIALALLLGCDYTKGVPGVGKETALRFLEELQDCDAIERYRDWKEMDETQIFPGYDSNLRKQTHCKNCNHIGSTTNHVKEGCEVCDSKITCLRDSKNPCLCAWHKSNEIALKHKAEIKIYKAVKEMADFPNSEVINEYLNYTDEIPEEDSLEWRCPNQNDFLDVAFNFLNWAIDKIERKFLQIMITWQLSKLNNDNNTFDQKNFLYEPIKILKQKTVKGEACFDVQWVIKDSKEQNSVLQTEEFVDLFKRSYPKIVEVYYNSSQKAKDKSKPKKMSTCNKGNKKISDMWVSKKVTHYAKPENEIPKCNEAGIRDLFVKKEIENEPEIKKQCFSL